MADEINIVVTAQDNFSGVLGNFGSIMSGIRDTVDLVGEAFNTAVEFFSPFIDAAAESQTALVKLQTVLASTGDSAGITQQQLIDLSSAMQGQTIFSDEQIQSAESMMLRFEGITGDLFPKAISLAADLASAMGIDLTQAAQTVGKALDDPVEGIGRLNTQFRLFTPVEMENIKAMAEHGDKAGAMALIMERLQEKVGGTAEAVGQTFTGQLDIAKNKMNDVMELIGGAFLPVLTNLLNMFIGFAGQPQVIQFFKDVAGAISGALQGVADLFITPSTSKDIFTTIYEGGMALSTKIGTDVQPAVFKSLEEITAGVQNRVVLWFTSIDWAGIATWIDTALAHAINSVDWNATGIAFGKGINTLFETKLSTNVATPTALQALGNALTSFIAGSFGYMDWASLSVDFWAGVSSIFTMHFSPPTSQHGLIGDWLITEFNKSVYTVKEWWYNNTGQFFDDMGKDITAGIGVGFGGSINQLLAATDKFITDFVNFFKQRLGIASPSTVFATLGANIMQGLMAGIESMFSTVMAMITSIVGLLLAPFKPILDLLGIDISSLSTGSASTGSVGGGVDTGGPGGTGTSGGGTSSGSVTNNYYGPVYFQGGAEPSSYVDCPSPNPIMTSSSGTLVIHAL